jgi:hypothetical protein
VQKRSIERPGNLPGDLQLFWQNELNKAGANNNILLEFGLPVQPGDVGGGISTSTLRIFGNQAFNFGAVNQRGCTSIWVFAKQGMWAAHIWELPGMGMVDLDENGRTVEQNFELFQPMVLNFISNGNPSRPDPISFTEA